MPRRCISLTTVISSQIEMIKSRIIYLVICTSFALYFYWIKLKYPSLDTKERHITDLINKSQKNAKNLRNLYSKVGQENKLPTDLKYILFWNGYDYAPFYNFEIGQKSFIKNNCSSINCYVTNNSKIFNNDITMFDVVAFNGRTMSTRDLPTSRSPRQKYIYFNMESAENFPVCDSQFDSFFNWTATYKLDSDIQFPYLIVRNKQREIVGPQINMQWPETFDDVDDDLSTKLRKKSIAAAWFVSHCSAKSGRDQFVKLLQNALKRYGLTVDVYGSCGPLKCHRNEQHICDSLLERDYFFYMSMENTFADDYVTEKLLIALQHDMVPIVYGGANYSRFLPPGSYIDSRKLSVGKLASTMYHLMKTPETYRNFFKWKSQYTYSSPAMNENLCAVCAAMNNKFETVTIYDDFRKWWNPDYKNKCR